MFPTLPLESFPLVISSLGLTRSALEVTQGTQGLITSCFTSFPTSPIPYCYYFGRDQGYKVCQHSSDISSTGENSKEEEFLHSNTNAKISVYDHILSNGPYREFLKFLSVSCTHANIHTHTRTHARMHGKEVCFIPTRVENLCLIDYSLKIHTGFSILSSMSSDTILIEMPGSIFLARD